MANIITVTLNPAVDKYSEVEKLAAGPKLRCGEPEFHAGGGGINVARAVSELGGDATAYWMGGGVFADLLARLLDEVGVAHRALTIADTMRENTIIYEQASDQQYRFCLPGATPTDQEIDACRRQLRELDPQPDYLVFSGSLPPGVSDDLYAVLADSAPPDTRVILDTHGEPLRLGLQSSSVYLIKPNIRELGQVAGRDVEDDSQICEVARSLIGQGSCQIVMTSLGSGGAVVTTADDNEFIRAPTVHIRSKVGAGDSTVAGVVKALADDRPLKDAVRFGVAAGAAAVMTPGTELCRRDDVERLYQEVLDQERRTKQVDPCGDSR